MSRTSRVRALVFTALLAAAGCQDYNFNPVGECLIKPNLKQVELSDVTSADVLFVVDDSGSMGGEQTRLSAAFDDFISNLNQTNLDRVAEGLVPIDFHLAVTTTSVYENLPDSSAPFCRSDCPDPQGGTVSGPVCCKTLGTTPVGPYLTVKKCSGASDTSCPGGTTCQGDCTGLLGEYACCDDSKTPTRTELVPCTSLGAECGDLSTHYRMSSSPACSALKGRKYPQGDFVASGSNPAILHFDKEIYAPPSGVLCTPGVDCQNKGGQTAGELIAAFKANVMVGTCGSNQEQGLEAARRAVSYWMSRPADTREWLHPKSKLVLVFVGDEDDCSSPQDASNGIILKGTPGSDSCVSDAALPLEEQKELTVDSFTHYFSKELDDRPLGAAFIVSARGGGQDVCQDENCVADICCDNQCTVAQGLGPVCTSATCGGQAKGTRLLQQYSQLRSSEADVVAGSICDPDFGTLLGRIAEIVKPPSGLFLPSQPADGDVTVLRIATADGKTRKTCKGPAPAEWTAAQAAGPATPECPDCPYDWWFTATREQVTDAQKDPTAASPYVYINHDTNSCEASPGETYSAEYIGRLPDNGCTGTGATEAEAKQAADDSCVAMLGGRPGDWTCFAGASGDGACAAPTGAVVGTCLCGPRGGSGVGLCPADAPLQ